MNPLNKQKINAILELADGDTIVLIELLNSFLKDIKELSDDINSAVYNSDWKRLGFKAHTLKGLAGTIGANPLFEICKKITDSLEKDDTTKAVSFVNYLFLECRELKGYIETNYNIEDETQGISY